MSIFKDDKVPDCTECMYANVYIPYFLFPYADPACKKGHGKCAEGKSCCDFRPMELPNVIICYDCVNLLEKLEDYRVLCDVKGEVDVHGVCDYHMSSEKKR